MEQEIVEVANNERISIGNAKRKVMGANKNPFSTYAATLHNKKERKTSPRIVALSLIWPLHITMTMRAPLLTI